MVFAKTNTRHPLYNGVYAVITTNVPVEFKPEACPFIRGILRLAERDSVQLKYAPPYIYTSDRGHRLAIFDAYAETKRSRESTKSPITT